jgi:hypothetical protein
MFPKRDALKVCHFKSTDGHNFVTTLRGFPGMAPAKLARLAEWSKYITLKGSTLKVNFLQAINDYFLQVLSGSIVKL